MTDLTNKFLLPALLAVLLATHAYTQSFPGNAPDEVMQFTFLPASDTLYLQRNESEFKRLYAFVDQHLTAITSGKVPVYIDGYCASAGSPKENRRISFIRSNRVKSELIIHKGLLEKHFITQNHTTPLDGAKDIVIVTFRLPRAEPVTTTPEPAEEKTVIEENLPVPETPAVVQTTVEPVTKPTDSRMLDFRTNLLYDVFLLPTLGLEWHINHHVSIKLDGSRSWWGSKHGRVQKIWLLSPEVRWYMGHTKQFYVGMGANIGEANIYKGMIGNIISDDTGYQGEFYGGGFTAGYRLPVTRALAIDFNLGLGCTHFKYDTFIIKDGVRTYQGKNLTKNLWGPTQAGISLIWCFARK